jgi:hypothetical protein
VAAWVLVAEATSPLEAAGDAGVAAEAGEAWLLCFSSAAAIWSISLEPVGEELFDELQPGALIVSNAIANAVKGFMMSLLWCV